MNPFTSGNTGLQKQDEGRKNWERSTGISLNREGLTDFEKVYKTYIHFLTQLHVRMQQYPKLKIVSAHPLFTTARDWDRRTSNSDPSTEVRIV